MVQINCSICGGKKIYKQGQGWVCQSCKDTTFDDDITESMRDKLDKANSFRERYFFDEALNICNEILSENPDSQETNWCALLAEYQIVYLQNDKGLWTATFLDPDANPVPMNKSRYASKLNRAQQDDMLKIEEDRQKAIVESAKIPPYDVFISYKQHVSSSNSALTVEAKYAEELYKYLTKNKLRVFMDKYSLGGRLGWEAHIFGAIRSAKYMVVLGSSINNIESPWVKNEWMRFDYLKKYDRSKILSVAVPYSRFPDKMRLNEKLRNTQIADIDQRDWKEKLTKDILAVVDSSARPIPLLLSEAEEKIRHGKFKKAKSLYQEIINRNPKNVEALWGLVRCKYKAFDDYDIIKSRKMIDGFAYNEFSYIIDAGDDESDQKYYQIKRDQLIHDTSNYGRENYYAYRANTKVVRTSKKVGIIAFLLLIIAAVLFVVLYKPTYKITIDLDNGTPLITTTTHKDDFKLDHIPEKEHYSFLGLYDDPLEGNKVIDENGECKIEIKSATTLYAHWEANVCNIIFVAGEGELLSTAESTLSVPYNSSLSNLPNCQRTGYDFVGWFDSIGNQISEQANVLSAKASLNDSNYIFNGDNVTLTAKYEIKKFTLTLVYNDIAYPTETMTVKYGDLVSSQTLPEKDNGSKAVIGWSLSAENEILSTEQITNNLTLYAIWKEYKVFRFNTYGTEYVEQRVYIGENYNIVQPSRTGYEFNGYFSSDSYDGSSIECVDFDTSVTTFYAKWSAINYSITYNVNGGDAISAASYTIENSIDLPIAVRENYQFLGWFESETFSGTSKLTINKGSYGNIILFAKWKGEDKPVVLDAMEGTITNSNITIEFGQTYKLAVPTYEGYEFQGWYSEDDKQITDKQGNGLTPWDFAIQTTLHAVYLKKYYVTVTYSHSVGYVNVRDYYVKGDNVSLTVNLVNNGYKVIGFFVDEECVSTSTMYSFVMVENDINVHVEFEAKEFTITLDSDGGYCSGTTETVVYGENYNLPVAFKQGYIFSGWMLGGAKITSSEGSCLNVWAYTNDATIIASYSVDPDAANKVIVYDSATLSSIVNAPNKTYVVVTDIDMLGVSWTPFDFSGTINGNGFTIKNLSVIASSGDLGMFTTVSGAINDLNFENIEIKSTSFNDVYIGGVCASLTGTLDNVVIKSGNITGSAGYIGGLVGSNEGIISNCSNYGSVYGEATSNSGASGGIAATGSGTIKNTVNNGTVENSYNAGGIIGYTNNYKFEELTNYGQIKGDNYTGGIIGYMSLSNNCTLQTELNNYGVINGKNYVGGIIGYFNSYYSEKYSFNTKSIIKFAGFTNNGEVEGQSYVGGIIGYLKAYNGTYGITNDSSVVYVDVTINRMSNNSTINGAHYIGGIVGYIYATANGQSVKLTCSYLNNAGDIVGTDYVAGIIGYSVCAISSQNVNPVTNAELMFFNNSGNITGNSYVGGLIGYFKVSSNNSKSSAILDSYDQLGTVTGDTNVSSLVGASSNLTIK